MLEKFKPMHYKPSRQKYKQLLPKTRVSSLTRMFLFNAPNVLEMDIMQLCVNLNQQNVM